jgi:AcrR family transcriptional regulator
VTATARRAQIIEATIEVLAELGYAQTSFARIAERARLSSTRLISYHFAGKDELLEQVVVAVTDAAAGYMGPRIESAAPGRERLRAYIESNLEWMAGSPAQIVALLAIFNSVPNSAGGQPAAYASHYQIVITRLEDYLREGQRAAELRAFPPRMAAVTIRAAIDAAGYRLGGDPDFDVAGYGRELADFFDQAVRGHARTGL